MLYTRKGDNGISDLFSSKCRYPKNSPIYDALGTLDELNSLLGVCRASASIFQKLPAGISAEVLPELFKVQECLFVVQAELAGAKKSVSRERVVDMEKTIDCIERMIPAPGAFVIPGATMISAWCDYARAVARRAERAVISAQSVRTLSVSTMAYLNRLSSLLYALARYSSTFEKAAELSPSYIDSNY
jgi:cob(I)alamin adenosyltransferase